MATRSIETEQDRAMLVRYLVAHPLPFTVQIEAGASRSSKQNRLNRQWMLDIAAQRSDYDAEGWRAYCKLHFGVGIRKASDEAFAEMYDRVIRPLPYEAKIALMRVPIDLPVTRDMNTKQMTQYLDQVQQHFASEGVVLTDPELLGLENLQRRAA